MLTIDQMDDINGLHIIHVSGTNGKGSVCAFTASFLQTHQQVNGYPRKIGLYTSPHIKSIRERIQINGAPISENVFRERFFQVWDKLPKEASSELDIPRYLQLLTLVSYHVFITEHVDVAVYETHLGGEFDATNIVVNPLATAVTRVAEDHIHLLGPTIEDIAWHKGGIFKSGAPALSSFQSPPVARILQQRAEEKTVQLEFIGTNPELDGLAYSWLPEVQKANCSLALTLTRVYLEARGSGSDKLLEVTELLAACKQPVWPGRFQHIKKGSLQLYIDGAHNKPSIPHAVHWFADSIANQK
jgi:folylpolyglutamate synthase